MRATGATQVANAAAGRRRGAALLGHRLAAGVDDGRRSRRVPRLRRHAGVAAAAGRAARRRRPVPRSIACSCRSPTTALVAVLLATGETVWERTLLGADHGAARARRSAGVRHDGEGSDEHRSVARPRAMDVEHRRRHGRQPGRRRQADLLRVARQHPARRRSQERQPAMEGRPVVAPGRRAAAARRRCC